MGEERKEVKKPTLFTAVLPLIFMFVVLFTGLVVYSIDIKILLIIRWHPMDELPRCSAL